MSEKPLYVVGSSHSSAPTPSSPPPPRTLLWDSRRRCFAFHWQRLLANEADRRRYLEELQEVAPWQKLYNSRGDEVSRLTCWYVRKPCSCDYTYGRDRISASRGPRDFCNVMEEMTERVFTVLCPDWDRQSWPNSANLNLYLDHSHHLGWHADDEALFAGSDDDCLIVSLSLGECREFWLAAKTSPDSSTPDYNSIIELDLRDGDLLTMEGLCQKHCLHSAPHGPDAGHRGDDGGGVGGSPRINITWRWIRSHKRRCPLRSHEYAEVPWHTHAGEPPAAASAFPIAYLWVRELTIRWSNFCGSCNWSRGRNCMSHQGGWQCRLCWLRQRTRQPSSPSEAARLHRGRIDTDTKDRSIGSGSKEGGPELGQAVADFDGSALGGEHLTLARGSRLVRLGSRSSTGEGGWTWAALAAGAPGWFPPWLTPEPGAGGAACSDFDGAALGSEYLTVARGCRLAQLKAPEGAAHSHAGWVFGVMLQFPFGWVLESFFEPCEPLRAV